jgi:hypothetical protein
MFQFLPVELGMSKFRRISNRMMEIIAIADPLRSSGRWKAFQFPGGPGNCSKKRGTAYRISSSFSLPLNSILIGNLSKTSFSTADEVPTFLS